MQIRMLEHIAGADFVLAPGDVTDRFSDDEARRLVQRKSAVFVAAPKIETAERFIPAAETRAPKRKARG